MIEWLLERPAFLLLLWVFCFAAIQVFFDMARKLSGDD